MISYAFIGFIQALFAPGFLILLLVGKKLNLSSVDKLIISTPLSILANYLIVTTLVYLNFYSRAVILSIFIFEFFSIFIFLYKNYSEDNTLLHLYNERGVKREKYSTLNTLLYIFCLSILLSIYSNNYSGAFQWWDAVASWNRWATEWFNQAPGNTGGYPPGIPILYSLVYKIGDSTNLQTIARQVACFFPFWGLLCFWRAGALWEPKGFISGIAALIYVYLIVVGNSNINFIFAGYVDPVMASFGVFIIYSALLIDLNKNKETNDNDSKYFLFIIFLAISSLALIKQSGVVVCILFAIYALCSLRKKILTNKIFFTALFTGLLLIISSYYIYFMIITETFFNSFVRADELIPKSLTLRILGASKLLVNLTGGWFYLIIILSIFFDKFSRKLLIIFTLPTFLFWAISVSYDLRTAYIFLPWLALMAGVGLSRLTEFKSVFVKTALILLIFVIGSQLIMVKDILQNYYLLKVFLFLFLLYAILRTILFHLNFKIKKKYFFYSIFSLVVLVLLVLPIIYSRDHLILDNTNQRIVTGNQGFNVHLSNLFDREPNAKMISCFAYPYNILASEGRFFPVGACGKELYVIWINRSNINYLLHLPPDANNNPEDLRALLRGNGISFSEEVLAKGYILFKRNN